MRYSVYRKKYIKYKRGGHLARSGLRTKAVYMNEELDAFWAELKTRYPYNDLNDTGILARLIRQEAILSRSAVELDPMALSDIDYLVVKMSERAGRTLTRSAVVREVARDKAVEYETKKNNAARITDIMERLAALEAVVLRLVNLIERGEK